MNPRLRLALICTGVAIFIVFVLFQVYSGTLAPLLAWRGERTEDRAAFQSIAELKMRSEIERALPGWSADRLQGKQYCELLLKRRTAGGDGCKAADQEIVYQRQRAVRRTAPLTPLKIVVVYDRSDRVIISSTLD